MRGLVYSLGLVMFGLPTCLLGLWTNSEFLMAAGGGAIAVAWVGWPVLLLGAMSRDPPP